MNQQAKLRLAAATSAALALSAALSCRAVLDRALRHQLAYVPPGNVVALPRGVTAADTTVALPASTSCVAVRFASTNCNHCWNDSDRWQTLVKQLINMGCQAIEVAPAPSDAPPRAVASRSAVPTLVFVDMQWIDNGIRIREEPTLLLLGGHPTTVRWLHAGELSDHDVLTATRIAAAANGHR